MLMCDSNRAFGKIFSATRKADKAVMVLKQISRGAEVDKMIPFLDKVMINAVATQREHLLVPHKVFVTDDVLWVTHFFVSACLVQPLMMMGIRFAAI